MIQFLAEALELDLPTKPKFLLVCLSDCADMYGVCYPSMATLSRRTSMPERTLQRCMRFLIENGAVTTFWQYTTKIRDRKIQHFRLNLSSARKMPQPDLSNCTNELRLEVISRFQMACVYCGGPGDELNGPNGKPWHINRIVPGSRGGQYVADNVTLSCGSCNMSKGAKMAPPVKSLGAILTEQGCQNSDSVVPPMAPDTSLEPSLEPSFSLTPPSEGEPASKPKEPTPPKEPNPVVRRRDKFVSVLGELWSELNPRTKYVWEKGDYVQLANFLKRFPELKSKEFRVWFDNYANSDGIIESATPKQILPRIHLYKDGPLNKYNRPMEQEKRGFFAQ